MLRTVLLAATCACYASQATAATPTISGNYVFNSNEVCQADIPNSSPGTIQSIFVLANFDSTSGMVTVNGTETNGSLVVLSGSGGLTSSTVSSSFAYSNTSSTITVDGQTLNAVYGKVKKGIADYIVFGGVVNSTCSVSGSATRK